MSVLGTGKKRFAALAAAGALVIIGGGMAYAYWTGTGTGVGTATTGASTSFTVTSAAPVGAALAPGVGAQTVTFTVTNPAAGSQNLSNVAVSVAKADGTAWTTSVGCSALDYAVSTPTVTYGAIASGDATTGTVTITMNNLGTNQDACQGVTAPLYFVAS